MINDKWELFNTLVHNNGEVGALELIADQALGAIDVSTIEEDVDNFGAFEVLEVWERIHGDLSMEVYWAARENECV